MAHILFLLCGFLIFSDVYAASETQLVDKKTGFSLRFSDQAVWQTSVEEGSDGMTACAVTPEGGDQFATICVKTDPKKHALALTVPSYSNKLIKGFLQGLCKPYQCKSFIESDLIAKEYGGLKGWQLTTDLQHPAYRDADLSGTVFFAAVSPAGQLQLFSLHTESGKTARYIPAFIEALNSLEYSSSDVSNTTAAVTEGYTQQTMPDTLYVASSSVTFYEEPGNGGRQAAKLNAGKSRLLNLKTEFDGKQWLGFTHGGQDFYAFADKLKSAGPKLDNLPIDKIPPTDYAALKKTNVYFVPDESYEPMQTMQANSFSKFTGEVTYKGKKWLIMEQGKYPYYVRADRLTLKSDLTK